MIDYNASELLNVFESASLIYHSIESDPDNIKSDEDLVPIYGVCRHGSVSKYNDNGQKKSDHELELVGYQKSVSTLSRGDVYCHAAISLSDDMTDMYSFDRTGFITESINDENLWVDTESIYITVMFIDNESFDKIRYTIDNFKRNQLNTSYNTSSILRQYLSKTPIKNDSSMICSTFVGMILSIADNKNLHRDYSRLRPEDITILPRAFYVGNYKDAREFYDRYSEFKSLTKSIYDNHREELLDYNNHLPKLMLTQKFRELRTSDKILTWVLDKIC